MIKIINKVKFLGRCLGGILSDLCPSLYRISSWHCKPITSFASSTANAFSSSSITQHIHFFRNTKEHEVLKLCSLSRQLEGVSLGWEIILSDLNPFIVYLLDITNLLLQQLADIFLLPPSITRDNHSFCQ